jgi:hypothetical protein
MARRSVNARVAADFRSFVITRLQSEMKRL